MSPLLVGNDGFEQGLGEGYEFRCYYNGGRNGQAGTGQSHIALWEEPLLLARESEMLVFDPLVKIGMFCPWAEACSTECARRERTEMRTKTQSWVFRPRSAGHDLDNTHGPIISKVTDQRKGEFAHDSYYNIAMHSHFIDLLTTSSLRL